DHGLPLVGECLERLGHLLQRSLRGFLLRIGHVARVKLLGEVRQFLARIAKIALRERLRELGQLAIGLLEPLQIALERLAQARRLALADLVELALQLGHALDRLAA
ncbi:MAG: hypothetical protein ACK559_12690, partial [bacterium]